MADHEPHITFPSCPECDAHQKAVGNWEQMTWFCFNCHSSGDWEIHTTTTLASLPPDDAESDG